MKNYHALLTIHDLPTMNKRQVKNLANWLKKLAHVFEEEKDMKIYSKHFRARLMK